MASRFSRRGAPDEELLEELAARGATLREMADATDRSISTVRYWLDRWKIERVERPGKVDPATAPAVAERHCRRHGSTRFVLEGRGYYRCALCRQERVSEWRRRTKRLLVEEAGGHCAICGYDSCAAALQFHHLDPASKGFALSRQGTTRSRAEARAEARKCVLLCANCHAEVEAGYRSLVKAA
ncbi:MAG TPA: hypothetical protein VH256_00425 [Thermoleophilaceae bacterium]|nr:hypothetical protein [Thermoleophilaceae bacterium]